MKILKINSKNKTFTILESNRSIASGGEKSIITNDKDRYLKIQQLIENEYIELSNEEYEKFKLYNA